MNKKILLSILAAIYMVPETMAEPVVQATGGLGYAQYEFEGYEKFSYPILDLGVNVGWSDFFFRLGTTLPVSDGSASGSDDFGSRDDTLNRTVLNINFGYRFYNSLAAFIGINYAQNSVDTSYETNYSGITSVKTDTEELGYHVGLAGSLYSWNNIGVLTAKGAISLANMNISYSDNIGQSFSVDSSSGDGYVVGIGWLGLINNSMTYYINFDLYRYSYEFENIDFKSNETDLKAGIAYTF